MGTIILDAELRAKLHGLTEQMAVEDETGQPLGMFLPWEEYKKFLYKNVKIPFTEEEMEKLRKAGGGCSLQEFWKRMGVS